MSPQQSFIPLSKEEYNSIKEGDWVTRMLAFCIPMPLKVTRVTDTTIITGLWEFDRNTGIEIDEDISSPVSYISEINPKKNEK